MVGMMPALASTQTTSKELLLGRIESFRFIESFDVPAWPDSGVVDTDSNFVSVDEYITVRRPPPYYVKR